MASKQITALAGRINTELGFNIAPDSFSRTYAGKNMKACGAFIWTFDIGQTGTIGGCWPVRKYLIKRNKLAIEKTGFNEYELFFYEPGEPGYNSLT